MALPSKLTARRDDKHGSLLGNIIRMLMSDNQGDALAALYAMARLLEANGCCFHDLADHVENGGSLSDTDKQKIKSEIENARRIGYAEGVQAAEA